MKTASLILTLLLCLSTALMGVVGVARGLRHADKASKVTTNGAEYKRPSPTRLQASALASGVVALQALALLAFALAKRNRKRESAIMVAAAVVLVVLSPSYEAGGFDVSVRQGAYVTLVAAALAAGCAWAAAHFRSRSSSKSLCA